MKANQTSDQPPPNAPAGTRPKVLFLWHDNHTPRWVAFCVRDEFEVITVHTRKDALEALANNDFCALLFRIISFVPDVDDQFPCELERLGHHLPVVILTAMVTDEWPGKIWWNPRTFPSGNVLALVAEPINIESILTVLRAALDKTLHPAPDTLAPSP